MVSSAHSIFYLLHSIIIPIYRLNALTAYLVFGGFSADILSELTKANFRF